VVRKLDCKTYNWGFKTTEVLSKETYMLNIFLASQFVRKFQNDHLLHYRYSVLVSFEVWYSTLLLPYLSLCIFLAIDESTIICTILKLNYVLWWLRDWTAKLYEQQQKFRYAREFCGKLGAGLRILATTYSVRVGGCTCCNTRFPPKNL